MVDGDVLGAEALGVPRLALEDTVAARLEALDSEHVDVTAAVDGLRLRASEEEADMLARPRSSGDLTRGVRW